MTAATLKILAPTACLLAAALVVSAGCSPGEPISPATPPAEDSWESQVRAVSQGLSEAIVVTEEAIDEEKFSQLREAAPNLVRLEIAESNISSRSLSVLAKCPRLEQLVLRKARVDDPGLELVSGIATLRIVNLPRANGGDESLGRLAGLSNLELLRIGGRRIRGRGLKAWESHGQLRFLHLIDTSIDDAALDSVARMQTLESFYLDGGDVSEQALDKLFAARPDLHVHLDQQHHDRDPHGHDHGHSH